MTRRLAVLATELGLGMAPAAIASGRQSLTVDLKDDTSLGGTKIPAGKYKIEAAHRKAGSVVQEVEVKDGEAKVDFSLEPK